MSTITVTFNEEEYAVLVNFAKAHGITPEEYCLDCMKWLTDSENRDQAFSLLEKTVCELSESTQKEET